MFSEKHLIRRLNSYWERWLPGLSKTTLSKQLARHADLITQSSWMEVMRATTPSIYNDLIAEISFHSFARDLQTDKAVITATTISPADLHHAIDKMALIRGGKFNKDNITTAMIDDAFEVKSRLLQFFEHDVNDINLHPRLRGYGRLSSCHPDILILDRLIEVKSSKYPFRVEDFRQVFLYAFLAHQNSKKINQLELLNPRRGEHIVIKTDIFCKVFGHSSHGKIMDRIAKDLK